MTRYSRYESVLDVYQLALAAVLFVSPWAFAFVRETAMADAWISAALVAAVSAAALVMFRAWEEWINAVLGVWIAASPFILGFPHTKAAHVMIGVGLVIAYLALLELWLASNRDYYGLNEGRPHRS